MRNVALSDNLIDPSLKNHQPTILTQRAERIA
jgi:hypothetical protein